MKIHSTHYDVIENIATTVINQGKVEACGVKDMFPYPGTEEDYHDIEQTMQKLYWAKKCHQFYQAQKARFDNQQCNFKV